MNRKTFITNSIAGIGMLSIAPNRIYSQNSQEKEPFTTAFVKEFVVAGHKDLNKVKEMLAAYPNLLYSSYDWGNGDFEEAIEGAAHVGNTEIAAYLIEQGARVNLFVMTMLGKTDIVKSVLEVYPKLLFARGPHGFTLLHHAKVGQQDALYTYLEEKGLHQTNIKIK